jgi:hypothetical protein
MNLVKRIFSPTTITGRWKQVAGAAMIATGGCLAAVWLVRAFVPGASPSSAFVIGTSVAVFLTILPYRR